MIQALVFVVLAGYARPELLVETDWVEAHLHDPDLRLVDTRTKGFEENHLPGAVHLDIAASRDKNNPPTYLPDLDGFVATLERLGISNETRIVFYDDRGGIYGTRPWVVLQLIGHTNAAILNGGWTKWTKEQRPVTRETPALEPGKIDVVRNDRWIATSEDVLKAIARDDRRIIDTRAPDEVSGKDLRNNPRGGAIPSSTPLDWVETLEGELRTFRPASELEALFDRRLALSPKEEIITYCQGGGRAAHELFVLYLMGYDHVRLYLGSMEDWSRHEELPLR